MTQPAPSGLKPSDYAAGAAIVTGAVGSSAFILNEPNGATIIGFALLLTTVFTSLSQFLQSRGD